MLIRLAPLLPIAALSAAAQCQIQLQRMPDPSCPWVTQVAAPGAAEMTLSTPLRAAVVSYAADQPQQLSLHAFDEQGLPTTAEPLTVSWPAHALGAYHVLSFVAHPTLPLLYVWQDIAWPGDRQTLPVDAAKDIDHLLVFRFADGKYERLQATARGADYTVARKVNYIALNAAASRLYFQGLTRPNGETTQFGVGYFELGEDGLVVPAGGGPEFEPKRVTAYSDGITSLDMAGGFLPISDEVVLMAETYGPCSWDLVEARQQIATIFLWPPRYLYRIAGHPTLPVFYLASLTSSYIHRLEHADGYITMNFEVSSVQGPFSAPVVIAPRQLVAYGGPHTIQLVSIDDEGRFVPEIRYVAVSKPEVSALAYSPQFDKLYVAVEAVQ